MRYYVSIAGRTIEVDLSRATPRVDGEEVPAELVSLPGTPVRHLLARNRSHALVAERAPDQGHWNVLIDSNRFTVEAVDERTRAIREMTGESAEALVKSVTAPMPGLVVRVEVETGQKVEAGQGVVIMEAMKMENELKAPAEGTVARIEVEAGQTVEKGATLIVLE